MARVAVMEMSLPALAGLLKGHPHGMSSSLPPDTQVIEVRLPPADHLRRDILWVWLESASFDDVPEAALAPQITPLFTAHVSEHDGLLAAMQRCPACPDCTGPDHYAAVRGIIP
jgi:hypothetical protein